MNYYERHLGDYARATAHLSLVEHGAYTLLLDLYYATEVGIPAAKVHRLARARTSKEKAAVDDVLREFFNLIDGVWTHDRVDYEVQKARRKMAAAQKNGKLGGRPRNPSNAIDQKPSGFPLGSISETQEKAHQTPDTRHQAPDTIGNEENKEHACAPALELALIPVKLPKAAPPGIVPQADLIAAGMARDTAEEFIAHKARLKAPLTPRAWADHQREAAKAGWTVEDAADKVMAKGWRGFEAKYVANDPRPGQPAGQPHEPAWRTEKRERMQQLAGPAAARPLHLISPNHPQTLEMNDEPFIKLTR